MRKSLYLWLVKGGQRNKTITRGDRSTERGLGVFCLFVLYFRLRYAVCLLLGVRQILIMLEREKIQKGSP